MKIKINPIDKKSIAAAIKELNRYEREFWKKNDEFARRLSDIGVSVANDRFSNAEYAGKRDVQVVRDGNDGRYSVIAFGETVGFLEFGTGIRYPEWDNTGMEYTPPPHGSYGKHQGLNEAGWWFAHGTHTYGNPPANAMLGARDAMIESVIQVATEVWNTHD